MKPGPLSQRKATPQLEGSYWLLNVDIGHANGVYLETAFVKTGRKLASTVMRATPSSFRDSSLSEFTPTLPRLRSECVVIT